MNKRSITHLLLGSFLLINSFAAAEECAVLFPDGASNSSSDGRIDISWAARITGSPDNILDTLDLNDSSGGTSCDSDPCSASGTTVPDEIISIPDSSTEYSLGFNETGTISPGNYERVTLSFNSQLTMEPGVYYISDDLRLGSYSEIVVSEPGTVIIYVGDEVRASFRAEINRAGGDRHVLLYSLDNINFSSSSYANALLYARDDIRISFAAIIDGALTAGNRISLSSSTTVNYDRDAIENTDYEPFCSQSLSTIIIQEETAGFCSVDGTIDSNHSGFTGSGFANPGFSSDVTTEWAIDGNAGTYTFNWRYALGSSARPGDLYVNDVFVTTVAFDSTGSWSTWGESSVSLSLAAGPKTISLRATVSGGLANLDYLEVSGPSVSPAVCAVGATLDYFEINTSASGSVCAAQAVTITAIGTDGDVLESYIGSIDLSTSSNNGTWSETGTAGDSNGSLTAVSSDGGSASYSFEAGGSDEGSITLNFENTHEETLTIQVNDSGEGVTTTSPSISFAENAFVIEVTDSLGDDLIAGRPHQFTVSMVGRDVNDPAYPDVDCGVLTNYSSSTIKAWITRSANDPSGTNPLLLNSAASDTITLENSEAETSDSLAVNFNLGLADVSLSTEDVGEYSIVFLDDSLAFSQSDIRGATQTLTIRPFGFSISVDGNAAAENDLGPVFESAGENFNVSVQAKGWHGDDDLNDDGVPDFYQEITEDYSNNVDFSGEDLPSFGQESTPETLQLSATQILPNLSSSQVLNGDRTLTSFASGAASVSTVYIDDVGIYEIQAVMDTPYLSASSADTAKANSRSVQVGRFIPSYFSLAEQSVTAACETSDFSYLSEPFSTAFSLEARSVRDTLTVSYEGDFAKLSFVQAANISAIDTVLPTVLSGRISMSDQVIAWENGVSEVALDLAVARDVSPDGPFSQVQMAVSITDGDGVSFRSTDLNVDADNNGSFDARLLGSTELYFGRLILPNVHGPESAALAARLHTEYWNGLAWLQMEADNCSAIAQTDIVFPDGTIDVLANRNVAIGSGSTTASFLDASSGSVNFSGGDAGLNFSAPGAGNTGRFNIDINLSAYPWLQFDWNQDEVFSDSALPSAEVRFGSYRGHDRVIYWQEVLN